MKSSITIKSPKQLDFLHTVHYEEDAQTTVNTLAKRRSSSGVTDWLKLPTNVFDVEAL